MLRQIRADVTDARRHAISGWPCLLLCITAGSTRALGYVEPNRTAVGAANSRLMVSLKGAD
jgi:hypothetical protein